MVDKTVSRFRRWLEDRLPWYDREAELKAEAKVETHRQEAIKARVEAEVVQGHWRTRLSAYGRVRIHRD